MDFTCKKEVLFHLAWIENPCGRTESAHILEVVLKITDATDHQKYRYVSFTFSSIDEMILYLKTLAKYYNAYSIDSMRKTDFPARIEIEEGFNRPDILKAFLLPNGSVWPHSNTPVHFLMD